MTDNSQTVQQSNAPRPVPDALSDAPKIGVPNVSEGELAVSPQTNLREHHLKFADFEESYIGKYIALADTKATLAFGLTSGLIGYVISAKGVAQTLARLDCSREFWTLALTVVLLASSSFCSFRVIAPRLFNSTAKGIVFFGSVATFRNAGAYVEEVSRTDEQALARARLSHCYDLARVCRRKYLFLRIALWLGLIAIVDVFVVMVMLGR